MMISRQEIIIAQQRIKDYIHRTPILTSASINQLIGAELYFKCENFQKVGAFKMRGAANAILSLSEAERKKGVATHSSGNHAQAVALAAKKTETAAYIVMPETAPKVKVAAVKGYEASITFCAPTLEARESTLKKIVQETRAHFIPPYDDRRIIAGQATATWELLEDVAVPLDTLFVPVGGGGLLSGAALSAYYFGKNMEVIGTEPAGADDAYRSFKSGSLIPSKNPRTIADGLLTSLGNLNFEIIRNYVTDIWTVEDQFILKAMQLIWERMKIVVEPSAAVPLAAIFQHAGKVRGKRIGIILSGGNLDLKEFFDQFK